MDNNNNDDIEIDLEQEKIREFVNKHPYPSYEDVANKLDVQLWAEYGKVNHNLCKSIYDNSTNDAIILKAGKRIYRRGGTTALRANLYVLQTFYNHPDPSIKSHPKWIEIVWQDICDEWRA
jgi:hypothetical protein